MREGDVLVECGSEGGMTPLKLNSPREISDQSYFLGGSCRPCGIDQGGWLKSDGSVEGSNQASPNAVVSAFDFLQQERWRQKVLLGDSVQPPPPAVEVNARESDNVPTPRRVVTENFRAKNKASPSSPDLSLKENTAFSAPQPSSSSEPPTPPVQRFESCASFLNKIEDAGLRAELTRVKDEFEKAFKAARKLEELKSRVLTERRKKIKESNTKKMNRWLALMAFFFK